jgi:hypothetical protein
LPSTRQPQRDTDALVLLTTLLNPSQRDQAHRLLVESDFLAEDIDHIDTVAIRTQLSTPTGKPYCIVSSSGRSGWTWDVLLFLYRGGKWCRVGRIPLPGQKGYEPLIIYVPGENTGVLSIEHIASYGTGVFQKVTTWYRVGADELVPLFSYPVQAYVVGWGLPFQRHITGHAPKILYVIEEGSKPEIILTAEYSAEPTWLDQHQVSGELSLFKYAARLILEWDRDARRFLPANESTATFDQVEGPFNLAIPHSKLWGYRMIHFNRNYKNIKSREINFYISS